MCADVKKKKDQKKREKVINKNRHSFIWTDRSKWRIMGNQHRVSTTVVAEEF